MNSSILVTKFGKKFSVRIKHREEGYQLVDSIDDLIKLIRREFGES